MATAVKNIAGLSMAPLGAFSAPLVNSNLATINILGTTGMYINTITLQNGVNYSLVDIPFTERKNIIVQLAPLADSSLQPVVRLRLTVAATQIPLTQYTVDLYADKTKPIMTYVPISGPIGNSGLDNATLNLSGTSVPTATVQVIIYGD